MSPVKPNAEAIVPTSIIEAFNLSSIKTGTKGR
jgi:hypothetical protein